MTVLKIERIGGLAGLGTTGIRMRSRGECPLSALSAAEQQAVDNLFNAGARPASTGADIFHLRITRTTAQGEQTVVVPEDMVPARVRNSIKDELL